MGARWLGGRDKRLSDAIATVPNKEMVCGKEGATRVRTWVPGNRDVIKILGDNHYTIAPCEHWEIWLPELEGLSPVCWSFSARPS